MNIHVVAGKVRFEADNLKAAFEAVHAVLHERWRDRVIMAFFEGDKRPTKKRKK